MTDAQIYQAEFGPDVAAHILKVIATARGIKAAQGDAVALCEGMTGPARSTTALRSITVRLSARKAGHNEK